MSEIQVSRIVRTLMLGTVASNAVLLGILFAFSASTVSGLLLASVAIATLFNIVFLVLILAIIVLKQGQIKEHIELCDPETCCLLEEFSFPDNNGGMPKKHSNVVPFKYFARRRRPRGTDGGGGKAA